MSLGSSSAGSMHAGKLDSLKKLREKLEDKKHLKKEVDQKLEKKERSFIETEKREESEIEGLLEEVEDFEREVDEVELSNKSEEGFSEELKVKKKQIKQLANLFRKNKVLKNPLTLQFVQDMFEELPAKLIDDMYDVYNDVELLKMRYG